MAELQARDRSARRDSRGVLAEVLLRVAEDQLEFGVEKEEEDEKEEGEKRRRRRKRKRRRRRRKKEEEEEGEEEGGREEGGRGEEEGGKQIESANAEEAPRLTSRPPSRRRIRAWRRLRRGLRRGERRRLRRQLDQGAERRGDCGEGGGDGRGENERRGRFGTRREDGEGEKRWRLRRQSRRSPRRRMTKSTRTGGWTRTDSGSTGRPGGASRRFGKKTQVHIYSQTKFNSASVNATGRRVAFHPQRWVLFQQVTTTARASSPRLASRVSVSVAVLSLRLS